MNIKQLLFVASMLASASVFGQSVAINNDGSSADTTSILDLQSTSKGLLTPRMTEAQRTGIADPALGLLVYQTDGTSGFYYNAGPGTNWQRLSTETTGGGTSTHGALVPFSSGLPITMTTVVGGLPGTSSIIGFGNSATDVSIAGGAINLTGGAGTLLNFAFSMPADGTITDMSAFFSSTAALVLIGSAIDITAQLYSSSTPDNTFTAVPGASVTLSPTLTGILTLGTTASGTTSGLSIPVTAGTRLLLVFSAQVTAGIDVSTTIFGYGSAGVKIQ